MTKILSRDIALTPYFFERFQKKYILSESTEIEWDLDQLSLILVGLCVEFSRKNVESLSEVYFWVSGRKNIVLIVYWGFVEICQKFKFFSKKLIFLAKSEYFSKCRQTEDFSFGTKVLYPKLLHFSGVFSFASKNMVNFTLYFGTPRKSLMKSQVKTTLLKFIIFTMQQSDLMIL